MDIEYPLPCNQIDAVILVHFQCDVLVVFSHDNIDVWPSLLGVQPQSWDSVLISSSGVMQDIVPASW